MLLSRTGKTAIALSAAYQLFYLVEVKLRGDVTGLDTKYGYSFIYFCYCQC